MTVARPRVVSAARYLLTMIAVIVVAKVAAAILDAHGVIAAATPIPVVLLGAITGTVYGLLAVGVVLVYRANRIINFAHGQIGAFGAALFDLAAVQWGIPYWVAFPLAMAASALIGAVAEIGVVRRLRNAPRLMSVIATLGVGQLLVVLAAIVNDKSAAGQLYPQPSGLPSFSIGALEVTPSYSGMLVLSPVVVVAIAVFLKRSRYGLGIRAAAANPDAARMAGIFAGRMSSLAWSIAGALAAFTAILIAPTQSYITGDSFGPSLLMIALTAAVVARMESLPLAFVTGIGIGVLEQLLLWNYPRAAVVDVVLFVVIVIALLLQRAGHGRANDKSSWAAAQGLRPIPRELRQFWLIRNLGVIGTVVLLGALCVLPLLATNALCVAFTEIIGFAIVGLSIGVLTGLSGQLTLGQFAIASIGMIVSFQVSRHTASFPLALLLAAVGAGLASVLVGLPALRIRGLMLTVTTLGFALAGPWLLSQSWALGGGVEPSKPTLGALGTLDTGRRYCYFAIAMLALALVLAWTIRRSGFGRLLVAIRDNEDNARAFAIKANVVKLQGYFVAGCIAGIGGATYGHSLSTVSASTFPTSASIDVAILAVLGGVSTLVGPLIGAVWVLGLPLLDIGNIGLAATHLGALLLILWRPSGLIQIFAASRDLVVRTIARRYPAATMAAGPTPLTPRPGTAPLAVTSARPEPPAGPLLEARGLSKHYGGVSAVTDVSFAVASGETVGLIGPNGAGKTTTFELLGGFSRADSGSVLFAGRDISRLGPAARAELGLIRSFQDAAMFPTMTAHDVIMLALERVRPTQFLPSVVGLRLGEKSKERRARELLVAMGLENYIDTQIKDLSTGTRRITEIACLIALEPVCLLLDEPSSGIAQRETEMLSQLLVNLKADFDLTMVIIEHDIPLIMGISDRIIAMADGAVIAAGAPDVVREDPHVVEAYLGGNVLAIERSGALTR